MKGNNTYTIFLRGVYSVNLGDDLFFHIILERYPHVRFIMYAPEAYKSILKRHSNCIVVSDSDRVPAALSKFCAIAHFRFTPLLYAYLFFKFKINIILIAGGSLFVEGNSDMPHFLAKLQLLRKFFTKLQIIIIGSNFGPCKTDSWKDSVAKALRGVDDICFRDRASYDAFSSIPQVRWANDIAMHVDYKTDCPKQRIVCVNIRSVDSWPTLKPKKESYLSNTKQIIEHYLKEGYRIKLISFCKEYGDDAIIDELFGLLDNKENVDRIYYDGNLEECLNVYSSSEIVVATRFHAIILGLAYHLDVLPISYSIKSENMLKSLGVWNPVYDYNAYCDAKIQLLLGNLIKGFSIDKINNKQFEYLDKLLMKNKNGF